MDAATLVMELNEMIEKHGTDCKVTVYNPEFLEYDKVDSVAFEDSDIVITLDV